MNGKYSCKDNMKDIYNGKQYKKVIEKIGDEAQTWYATCVFNSDGSPVFKSSTYSLWPIQISINEIPANIRQKETITWALWFGKNKPEMNTFLKVFVDTLQKISVDGINCVFQNSIAKNIKLYAVCCCVDSVARAPMQGITQFNGFYGCNWCLHPGKSVKNKTKGTTVKYVLLEDPIDMRTKSNMLEHMEQSKQEKKL
ncbi:hypothetical protein TKK_0016557 [Trichogramma kaykai]